MLILGDIQHLKNTYYVSQHQQFIQDLSTNVLRITKPVLYVETLHSCYTHMIEDLFRCYWVLQDLVEAKYIENDDVIFFIKKDNILKYPSAAQRTIDSSTKTYKGAWQKLFNVVSKNSILFEHLLEKDTILYFTNLFVLEGHDMYQHSPWNSFVYWPGREIPADYPYQHLLSYSLINNGQIVSRVRYDDATIQRHLLAFREKVLQMYVGEVDTTPSEKKRTIILNRKDDRAFNKNYLDEILQFCTTHPAIDFQGIHLLEDKSFEEQVKLFHTTDLIFAMHGSGLSNVLWAKKNSIVVEFDVYDNRFCMFHRLCSFLGIKKHSVLLVPNGTLGTILQTTLEL